MTEQLAISFNRSILDLEAPAIFFPVRHHSPTGAKLLRQLIQNVKPAALLIEGPSDFNGQIDQLSLPHQLPIAIYSYAHLADGTRRGAFYPYCVYSPEWQALKTAHALSIPAQFIDLPWSEIATTALSNHRYAETELHQSHYVQALGEKLGIEGLDNLWDHLFEINGALSLQDYLERCHQFCFHCRVLDGGFSKANLQREAFMVKQIKQTMADCSGQVVVVTGGYHSYALYAEVFEQPVDEPPPLAKQASSVTEIIAQETGLNLSAAEPSVTYQGAALTPFTYERLDSLSGYDAGMPSPGFYHQVWCERAESSERTASLQPYRQLFYQVVESLRRQKQVVSAADLIAVEAMAQSLADLRGHTEIWRQDISDAIVAALIKEPLHPERPHPFLVAVQQILQGQQRGQLAKGTALPPLVRHIHAVLSEFDLTPWAQARSLTLNLYTEQHRQRSQILHQLQALNIAGYDLARACDWIAETEVLNLQEEWIISWSPEFEASCIENAIYGCTLAEAATAQLQETAQQSTPSANIATHLLLKSFLMGLPYLKTEFCEQLIRLIQTDSNFLSLSAALNPLLFLYHYDSVLGAAEHPELGTILTIAYQRALWLLDSLGSPAGNSQQLLHGIKAILTTFERCHQQLQLTRDPIIQTCSQIINSSQQSPLLRGCAVGILWRMAATSDTDISYLLAGTANPEHIGDFLTGLFSIAREIAQRDAALLQQIDQIIETFDEETFLEALPALHLAFTYFTPREKYEISHNLMQHWHSRFSGAKSEDKRHLDLQPVITPDIIARVQAIEKEAMETLERYGLRGASSYGGAQ